MRQVIGVFDLAVAEKGVSQVHSFLSKGVLLPEQVRPLHTLDLKP